MFVCLLMLCACPSSRLEVGGFPPGSYLYVFMPARFEYVYARRYARLAQGRKGLNLRVKIGWASGRCACACGRCACACVYMVRVCMCVCVCARVHVHVSVWGSEICKPLFRARAAEGEFHNSWWDFTECACMCCGMLVAAFEYVGVWVYE